MHASPIFCYAFVFSGLVYLLHDHVRNVIGAIFFFWASVWDLGIAEVELKRRSSILRCMRLQGASQAGLCLICKCHGM
ncbi:hypothetical protein GQ44DRAFT_351548 [Phaeosphaeriaceae sp. PMI808]|nr:hypothetical protein GQ44DRAFT_351548 [Phaeosphaeriaceae sp. PMI808]